MKRKFLLLILSLVSFILIFILIDKFVLNDSKSRNVDIKSEKTQTQSKNFKTIGIIVSNMQQMYVADLANTLKEKAKENIKVLLYDSEGRNDKQILQLEELISLKADTIILIPNDRILVNKGIEEVKEAKIPIITLNMDVSSYLFDSYIGSDSVQAGELQGKFIVDKLHGKGNIVILAGQQDQETTLERLKGFKNFISSYPEVKIVDIGYCNWDRRKSDGVMKNILDKHFKIDAVVAQNDEILLGSLNAIDGYGLKPFTIGIDGIPEALEAIKDNRIDATIYQNSRAQANAAYDTITKIFKGQRVERNKIIPYETVTIQNVDDYLNQNLITK